jgi:hypothetical protein
VTKDQQQLHRISARQVPASVQQAARVSARQAALADRVDLVKDVLFSVVKSAVSAQRRTS